MRANNRDEVLPPNKKKHREKAEKCGWDAMHSIIATAMTKERTRSFPAPLPRKRLRADNVSNLVVAKATRETLDGVLSIL
jgi:hypothetical protein